MINSTTMVGIILRTSTEMISIMKAINNLPEDGQCIGGDTEIVVVLVIMINTKEDIMMIITKRIMMTTIMMIITKKIITMIITMMITIIGLEEGKEEDIEIEEAIEGQGALM